MLKEFIKNNPLTVQAILLIEMIIIAKLVN